MVDETRVRYKAIADFTALGRSVQNAKRRIRELREEEAKLNRESVVGSARATVANNKRADSIRNLANATKEQVSTTRAATVQFIQQAKAARDAGTAQTQASRGTREAAAATDTLANTTRRAYREMSALATGTRRAYREATKSRTEFRGLQREMNGTVKVADRLHTSFRRLGNWRPHLTPPFIALVPIIAGLIGLVNPLVAGLGAAGAAGIGFASSLGSIAGAALTAIPALGTLLSVVGALGVAFGGIGGAFGAFGKMKNAAGGGGGGGTPAKAELTQTEEIARAQERYARSIQDVAWAEEDLAEARKDYLKRLKEIRKEVEEIALAEAEAAANVQLARENYANVLADPGSTKGEKMAAKAALERAQEDQKDLREENAQLRKDLADMEAKGMEGDRSVIQAQRALTDATWAQRDAQLALINAQNGANQAMGGGGGGAANLYRQALEKLSPSARRFVETIVAMNEAWTNLKKNVQERFFSQFVDNVDRLRLLFGPLESLLGNAADSLGRFVNSFLLLITSPEWQEDIILFGEGNVPIIDAMGDGVLSLLDGIKDLAVGAQPALQRLAEGFRDGSERLAEFIEGTREDGSLASFLDKSIDRLSQWWRIIKNVGSTLFNYGKAADDFAQWITDGLEDTTEGWLEASEDALGPDSSFRKFLEDIKPLVSEIKGVFGDFFKWFAEEASDTENINQMVDILRSIRDEFGPALASLFDHLAEAEVGPRFVDALTRIVELLDQFAQSPASKVFFEFLNFLLEALVNAQLGTALGWFATALGPIAALSLIGKFTGITSLIGWLLRLAKGGKGLPGLLSGILSGFGGLAGVGGTVGGGGAAGTRRGPGGGGRGAGPAVVPGQTRSQYRAAAGVKAPKGGLGGIKGLAGSVGKFLAPVALMTELFSMGDYASAFIQGLNGQLTAKEAGLQALGSNTAISLVSGFIDTLLGQEQGTALSTFNDFLGTAGENLWRFFSNQDEMADKALDAAQMIRDNRDAYAELGAQIDIAAQKMAEGNWTTQQTIDMFTPYTDAIYDTTQAMQDAGQPYENYKSYLMDQRSKLYDSMIQMGYNKDEAKRLSDQLVQIPDEGYYNQGSNLAQVQKDARDTNADVNALAQDRHFTVKADATGDLWSKLANGAKQIGDFFGSFFGGGQKKSNGGRIQRRNKGGSIRRAGGGDVPGAGNSDTVPAMLTPGEFVVRKAIVNRVGLENLTKFNAGVMSYAEMLQSAMANSNSGQKSKNVGGGMSFFNGGGLVPDLPDAGGFSPRPPGAPAGPGYGGTGGDAPIIGGDLIINNPVPETASDSLPRTIRKMAYLGGRR